MPRTTINGVLACASYGYMCGTPTVTNVSPNVGPTAGGTTVTITGTNFNNTTVSVKFGSASATGVVVNSDTSITAHSPASVSAGTVDVVVTTNAGSSATSSADQFTYQAAGACATAGVSPDKASPQQSGTIITFTFTSTGCANPDYKLWIGFGTPTTWVLAQDYGHGASYVWNTAGNGAVAYVVDVWARQTGHTLAYEAFSTINYTLTAPVACAGGAVTPDKASPQQVGTLVTFTGSATGCSQPLFRFWVLPPGGTWTMVRDFSTSATYVWNTAGMATGAYTIDIWAHQNGSSTAAQTGGAVSYTLVAAVACAGANVTPDKASPQAHGTAITFTATSTGCSEPLYQFYVQAPGGSWTVAQPGSLSNTFVWNTTGLAAGTYNIDVWVYQNGTAASSIPQTFKLITYTLT